MKSAEALIPWIKLWRVSGVGARKFSRLLETFETPAHVFESNASQLMQAGMSSAIAQKILEDKTQNDRIQPDLDWLNASAQHQIITLHCDEYPQRLKHISNPPALLYVHGNISLLKDPQLGVVGSRNPTQSGINNAFEFAKHLGQTGLCITSGLALGIDGQAHLGAIAGNGPTIAVIATGIDRVYPAKHRDLAHNIVKQGAIISEFPVGSHPDSRHFPRRNRIISGMSYGVLVVEAALKSGSLITARLAMEQNRDVFAIPGSIHNPLAKGCHQLIRQGAKLVETADDILEEMASVIDLNDHQSPAEEQTVVLKSSDHSASDLPIHNAINEDQQRLLDSMGFDPITIDTLVTNTRFDAAEIAAMLLILELNNYVTSSGGGTYTRFK